MYICLRNVSGSLKLWPHYQGLENHMQNGHNTHTISKQACLVILASTHTSVSLNQDENV